MYEDGNALYAPLYPSLVQRKDESRGSSSRMPYLHGTFFLMRADLNWDEAGVNLARKADSEEHPTQALELQKQGGT